MPVPWAEICAALAVMGQTVIPVNNEIVEQVSGSFGLTNTTMITEQLTAHGIFQPPPCQGGAVTNIVGAGWTSTHNPTNASDHQPYVVE